MGISNWGLAWTLIMPIALILYYFYRKKYKDQQVSSILYWQQVMKEMQASPYLKSLQHHLLFYLQLAALLLLVLSLLNPYFKSDGLEGEEFIFIVDTSASMLAGSPSGLEQQKDLMKDLAEEAQGKPVTIINAGSTPEILIGRERSVEDLQQGIESIDSGYESAEIEKAVLFAETLLEENSGVIHIFTDSLDRNILANKTGAAYEVHALNEKPANVSLRQFGTAEGATGYRAIVQVLNDSESPVSGAIELSGGEHGVSTEIELEPGEEKLIPFENLPANELWQATLDVEDDYIWDNQAFTFNSQSVDAVIIDNALHNLVARGVESLGITGNSASAEELPNFTGIPLITNQSNLIGGNSPILLIGRNDETSFAVSGGVETGNHPLFAYAPMDDVYISSLYPGFDNFTPVATVDGHPFIQLSPQGDIIVLADIEATDWPLNPSFPLFLWSAVNELSGSDEYLGTFLPKERRSIALGSSGGEWEIFKGEEYQFSHIEGESNFCAPKEPGIYRAVNDEETKTFIVQLNNEEKVLNSGQDYSAGNLIDTESSTEHSVIPWLLLIILLLMLAEWEVYRRGTSYR
ncbi:vWA domain-containing protein [Metaplanococcus flavidus]|uniref:VWA domain-containing protein n=1 Tax=Metaplanococcus flavidus TaxID=569883 RepID=A0ABW3LBQ8_9BACL